MLLGVLVTVPQACGSTDCPAHAGFEGYCTPAGRLFALGSKNGHVNALPLFGLLSPEQIQVFAGLAGGTAPGNNA